VAKYISRKGAKKQKAEGAKKTFVSLLSASGISVLCASSVKLFFIRRGEAQRENKNYRPVHRARRV
jgi:hypothetical protein